MRRYAFGRPQINPSELAEASRPSINNQTGTTYTVTSADELAIVICTNASAITVTVPKDATDNLPVGYITNIFQGGAGQVTVAPEDGAVTVNSALTLSTRAQYSSVSLIKVAANSFYLIGDQG